MIYNYKNNQMNKKTFANLRGGELESNEFRRSIRKSKRNL